MEDKIKISQLNDRELLLMILTNQIVIKQTVDRMFNCLKEEFPDNKSLKTWEHYFEIFDDLRKREEDVITQVDVQQN